MYLHAVGFDTSFRQGMLHVCLETGRGLYDEFALEDTSALAQSLLIREGPIQKV